MGLELGLAKLVQGDPAVAEIAKTGGFLSELPKDSVLPSWTFKVVSNVSGYGLTTKPGLNTNRIQIDCYGPDRASSINLAAAIDAVLSGYYGTLSDPQSTGVNGIFQSDTIDFFDDARRSYRRMLEYEVLYYQN